VASPKIPEKIGRYLVTRELGRGGMGVVYLAQDPFIDRLVAIKVTLSSSSKDPQKFEQFQQAFFNEARAAGKLMHPHIVSVYDAMVEKDRCYLVMEYVDGSTLKEYCRGKTLLPLNKALGIIFQCAKGLDYAHQNGVIHRDIKPSNIMVSTTGDAKISDFGIATVEGASGLSRPESFAGSVHYMSPEQLGNEPLTPQSDFFSLGVVMYELLTGTRPFEADTDYATFYKIANTEPPPVRQHRRDVPESLERIVLRALEKDPSKRYRSGLQLASELSASFDHLRHLEEELNFEEKYYALKRLDFFKDFTSGELAEVLDAIEWLKHEATSTIITEGEIEDCFYIIVAGKVIVKKRGTYLNTLRRGDCFGEMAYRGNTTRTATVEAVRDTILIRINGSVIDLMSINTQLRFHKVFAKTLIQRLARISDLMSKGLH
jgi:serine/threonine protein kinase